MATVNLALQALPLSGASDRIAIIDQAIAAIARSGLSYVVCPFETVVEGEYEAVMKLVTDLKQACFDAGADELIINMKLHARAEKAVTIDEKLAKYRE
ncbi:MAG: thiamine-binding protein [Gammaproteobacteria bacterium]|nr:thiamine-binding protein [Gammaproteobacteria bacterium]